jgi:5-methylcytosine-specific restriction endonuclease McrA
MSTFDKRAWIENALRRASYKYPPRYTAETLARVERGKYRCNICKEVFRKKDTETDHIVPVVDPEKGKTDWNDYVERMFPDIEGFQKLCRDCHVIKSESENVIRREKRKEKK